MIECRMYRYLHFYIFIILIASAFVCLAGEREEIDCSKKALRCNPGEKIDNLLSSQIRRLNGAMNANILIEFLAYDHLNYFQTPEYLNVLNDELNTHPNFSAFLIVPPPEEKAETLAVNRFVEKLPIGKLQVIIDTLNYANFLGLERNCYMAVLVDSEDVVQFISSITLHNKTLSQLANTYGGAVSNLDAVVDTLDILFGVGKIVPDLDMTALSSMDRINLADFNDKECTCFLFSAACSKCQIRSFLFKLSHLQPKLVSEGNRKLLCLIDGSLEENELVDYVESFDINVPVFITYQFDNVPSRHFGADEEETNSKVIKWDERGVIYDSENIEAYFERLEGKQ